MKSFSEVVTNIDQAYLKSTADEHNQNLLAGIIGIDRQLEKQEIMDDDYKNSMLFAQKMVLVDILRKRLGRE